MTFAAFGNNVLPAKLSARNNVPEPRTVTRNETAPATIDDGGHVVVRDGVREDVDRTLGVPSYWITHRVSVEAIVGGGDPNGALDELLQAIEAALASVPQLVPGVSFVECDLADIETISADGAETFKATLFDPSRQG